MGLATGQILSCALLLLLAAAHLQVKVAKSEVARSLNSTTPSSLNISSTVSQNICTKLEPCANEGRCLVSSNSSYHCSCNGTGFGGQNCTVPLMTNCSSYSEAPCLNGGICLNLTSLDGPESAGFNCTCPIGFHGLVCEFSTFIDWCANNNCRHGAKCIPHSENQNYSCICTTGFTGLLCQSKIDFCNSTSCLNKGVCNSTDVGYNCTCQDGFRGPRCQVRREAVDCSVDKPCPNGGKCVDVDEAEVCDCTGIVGFDPVTCGDIDECSNQPSPCVNSLSCTNTEGSYTCECKPGYSGKNCDEVSCSADLCNYHGTCQSNETNWSCACQVFYYGDFCEQPGKCVSEQCNNGTCLEDEEDPLNAFSCLCDDGWLNDDCSTYNCTNEEINPCSYGLCSMMRNESTGQWEPHCPQRPPNEPGIPAEWIWAPIVAVVVAALLVGAVLLFLRVKQKRATGGNYSPSKQEVIGTRVQLEDIIKPPPEERLI